MLQTSRICSDDRQRRYDVRAHRTDDKPDLNGIDYIEVDADDQRILYVHFMDRAPENLSEKNVRITGGRRIRHIKALKVTLCDPDDSELADCMQVNVDRAGDFSTYTLCLVALDEKGHQLDQPLAGFDVRYACADFSFKANCPSDLDCQSVDTCPPPALQEPDLNYLAKDYASFRQLILDRLALIMPGWQERHVPDIGIMLVELLAYVGDYLSYYQDAVATEAYLDTARQRISVRRHARLVDYFMHEGCNARTWLFIETSADTALDPRDTCFITGFNGALPVGDTMLSDDDLEGISPDTYEVFEPLVADPTKLIPLYEAHNEIHFYTWGENDCCLPIGTTSATLDNADSSLHLNVGDVLIFEEVLGPKTGNPADADPTHRHVVRLTQVITESEDSTDADKKPLKDPLYNRQIVEIAWGAEDALLFPLCLSAIGPAPACELLTNISVARGNILLVDYGQTLPAEGLGSVEAGSTQAVCEDEGDPSDTQIVPKVFNPSLQHAPLTFSQPLPKDAPFTTIAVADPQKPVRLTAAASFLQQDVRKCLPWLQLTGTLADQAGNLLTPTSPASVTAPDGTFNRPPDKVAPVEKTWTVQPDLLESGPDDDDFVVEMDNDGFAHLRFGDGKLGHMPEAGTSFIATYRVGNGTRGNVGREAISHVVFHKTKFSGLTLQPRNPFPVQGGTDPEPLDEVRLFAPHAFRADLQRAITTDDYARLAMESSNRIQRAAATLNWTGSWYEVVVAIDPLETETASRALLHHVRAYLENYRRIGHDLKVVPAQYVPLDIAITICVLPNFLRGHVKAALLDLFSNRVLPGGRKGFFHPDNLTFGVGIALSKLVAVAAAVPGVQSVRVTGLKRLFEPEDYVQQEFLPIGPHEIAQLDNDPSFPEHGKLTLNMEGGR
ncbi:MAG TPA: putative baseplate assembly protein [Ktedonobacteraceae bacterium]|nr:putative baseplate assembly protein [Ktedonobacteraceae bacterium]